LFQDWQRTQTQSSVTALRGPRQRMDVRFCEGRNHRREAQVRAADAGECGCARSSEALVRRTAFPLDKDLHGGRQTGSDPETGFAEIGARSALSAHYASHKPTSTRNYFRLPRYPGLIPVGSQKLSSHYEFLATTIRITADKVHIAFEKKWRLLQVNWRDPLVPSTDVDI
jgi:hypothetical protein